MGLKHLLITHPFVLPAWEGNGSQFQLPRCPSSLGTVGFLVAQALLQSQALWVALGSGGISFSFEFLSWGATASSGGTVHVTASLALSKGCKQLICNFFFFPLLLSLLYSWSGLAVSPVCWRDVDPNCSLHVAV